MIKVINNYNSLNDYLNNNVYDNVYISIGSKKNINNYNYTDAIYQMYPTFIREHNNCLIIIVDIFSKKTILHKNIKILKNTLNTNTDCIIINKLCDKEFLDIFISMVISYLQSHNISYKNFMICNYVCYMNSPNKIEQENLNNIQNSIQNNIQNSIYNQCFYQWFGYMEYFNNYVYNYKNVHRLVQNTNTMNVVKNILLGNEQKLDSYEIILKNIYSITQINIISEQICSSAYQYIL